MSRDAPFSPESQDHLTDQLAKLAPFAEVFDAPDFSFGEWVPSTRQPDGAQTVPWFDFSSAALEFLRAAPVSPEVHWPDWSKTDEARRLLADPAAVADATPDQLVALLTTMIRGDRFSEGTLAHFYETGHLRAIIRRASELAPLE
ncbi:hypothetical protein BH23CHL7_BH23CHL7_21640 [soil metagenome]